jgi:hypothetical protein
VPFDAGDLPIADAVKPHERAVDLHAAPASSSVVIRHEQH